MARSFAPLTPRTVGIGGKIGVILFFSLLLLAGLAATYAMLLRPAWRILAARSWREVPCVVLAAAFWNGIVSVFLWQVIKSFQRGRPEWFLTVFLIPFVLVGLLLSGVVGYCFLQLFAPGVKLRLGAAAVPLGGSVDLAWEITGHASRIRKLRLWLEGREEATYRRGTTTSTDKSTFATIELASASLWNDIRQGRVRLAIPADTMHSFSGKLISLLWAIELVVEPGQDSVRVELTISPTGKEILLTP